MGLQIKSMDEVFSNLVDWITSKTTKITDFNVGSAIRTLTEAISIQFEEFYFDMKQNTLYAIENSIYSSFGFELKSSVNSSGYVTITFSEELPAPLSFPKGTVFCTSKEYGYIYFESKEDYSAPVGSFEVMIPVQCKVSGTIGNVPSGAITTIVSRNSIIDNITNTTPFMNGSNEETSSERKKRFQSYIKSLARGTADSIVYGALSVEGVAGACVDDNYVGYVRLFVHDSAGNLPEDLRQKVKIVTTDYRAGGIEVDVLPIVKRTIDIGLDVIVGNDYDTEVYNQLITALITSNLNDYVVGENFYVADLIHAIMNAYDGVIVNVTVSSGSDVIINKNELVRAGNLDVKCVNIRNWRA